MSGTFSPRFNANGALLSREKAEELKRPSPRPVSILLKGLSREKEICKEVMELHAAMEDDVLLYKLAA